MQAVSGMLLLGFTVALFFYYRPTSEAGLGTCAICAAMGLLSPVTPANTWFVLAVSLGAKALALGCCYLQLNRESRERRAAKARSRRAAEWKKLRRALEDEQRVGPAA